MAKKPARTAKTIKMPSASSEADDLVRLRGAVMSKLAAAIPLLKDAASSAEAASEALPKDDRTGAGAVLRIVARQVEYAVEAWNREEERAAAHSAEASDARDAAAEKIRAAVLVLREASALNAELQRAAARASDGRPLAGRRLRVRDLAKAVHGASRQASDLLAALQRSARADTAGVAALLESMSE